MTITKDFLDIQQKLIEYMKTVQPPDDPSKEISNALLRAWRAGYVTGYNDGVTESGRKLDD